MAARSYGHNVPMPFGARNFFWDAPWFSIPECRQAKILIEPSRSSKGLLGGSSTQSKGPPTSKLATLAAARKKENRNISSDSKTTKSVVLLNKLKKDNNESPPTQPKKLVASDDSSKPSISSAVVQKRYPVRQSRESVPTRMRSESLSGDAQSKEVRHEQTVQAKGPPAAAPSVFAKAIFGSAAGSTYLSLPISRYLHSLEARPFTNFDAFTGPSPDDVVLKAQGSSKGSK